LLIGRLAAWSARELAGWHHFGRGKRRARRRLEMSIFPTNILLATDGSEEAELAARTAVDLAGKTGSELHVVHVLVMPP
jgi:hypothetical protein